MRCLRNMRVDLWAGMLEDMTTLSTRGPVMTRVSCPVCAPPRVTRHVYQHRVLSGPF